MIQQLNNAYGVVVKGRAIARVDPVDVAVNGSSVLIVDDVARLQKKARRAAGKPRMSPAPGTR